MLYTIRPTLVNLVERLRIGTVKFTGQKYSLVVILFYHPIFQEIMQQIYTELRLYFLSTGFRRLLGQVICCTP